MPIDPNAPQTDPQQADPNQAPTSGNVVGGVPGIAQPEVQTPQPTTNAQAVNQVAKMPVSQAHLHTGIFHTLLSRMNQGDQQVVRDKNGNPVVGPDGKPQTQPMDSKQMGRSILAGVLSAMAASEQHQPYRNGNGVWVNPQNEAVQAGDQAFQAGRPKAQYQQATDQVNKQRTQAYATYEANVKTFKLAHEVAAMKMADKQAAVAPYSAAYDAGEAGDIDGYNTETGDLNEKDAEAAFRQMDSTKNMMVPNGKVVPVLDVKGNPTGESEVHYMILPGQNGNIPVTQKMISDHPELQGALAGKTQIPLTQWSKLVRGAASQQVASSAISDLAGTLGAKDANGDPIKFDYKQFLKDAKGITPDQISKLSSLSHDRADPVAFAKSLATFDTSGTIDNALRKQGINIDVNAWEDKRKAELKKQETEDTRNADPDKRELSPEAVAATPQDIQSAYGAKNGQPGLSPEQIHAVMKDMPDKGATALDRRRVMDKAAGVYFQTLSAGVGSQEDHSVDEFDDRGVNTGYLNSLPPGVNSSIKAYGEGRISVPARMGSTKEGRATLQMITRAYPDFKAGQSDNYVKTRQDFLTGGNGKEISAINTALGHAGKMFDNLNWWSATPGISQVRGLFGAKDVAELETGKKQLATEVGRAYQGGVITAGEAKEQQDLINSMSLPKLKSQLTAVVDFLESKIEDNRRKYENAIPQYMRNGDNIVLLNPQAAAAYTKITGKHVDPIIYGTPNSRQGNQGGNQLPAGLSFQRPAQPQQQPQ